MEIWRIHFTEITKVMATSIVIIKCFVLLFRVFSSKTIKITRSLASHVFHWHSYVSQQIWWQLWLHVVPGVGCDHEMSVTCEEKLEWKLVSFYIGYVVVVSFSYSSSIVSSVASWRLTHSVSIITIQMLPKVFFQMFL